MKCIQVRRTTWAENHGWDKIYDLDEEVEVVYFPKDSDVAEQEGVATPKSDESYCSNWYSLGTDDLEEACMAVGAREAKFVEKYTPRRRKSY